MPPLAAGLLVFFTSAAVLVLEILAGRLLAPYVGVTLETWTGIIGVVLAGIALGSWYGGRLADRVDPRTLLGPMTVLGGILALFALPLITFFGVAFAGGGVAAILILSTVGFFAPATVLSAVTPTVIKLQLSDLDETGAVVGRLSALSTVGAIFGTFFTGFVLVAALPSRPILIAVGVGLVATGLVLWRGLPSPANGTPAQGAVLGLLGLVLTAAVPGPCQVESAYFCARVEVDPDRPSGRILQLDRLSHSYVDLDDPTHLEFGYTQLFGDVLSTVRPGEPIDALHIGGGGFSMPRYIEALRPGSTSVVLELDPSLLDIARDELGLETSQRLRVEVGDARLGIDRQPDDAYDVVIGDAFGGVAVPWHLTTVEVVESIRRSLRPDGVYVLNVIDYPPLGFARAETATLRAVFDHVAVVAAPQRIARAEGGNLVLVASDAPLDLTGIRAAIAARGGEQVVATDGTVDAFVGDARVLTDDFAPVDQLLTPYG
jgi:SAM-dependent methyltransferase